GMSATRRRALKLDRLPPAPPTDNNPAARHGGQCCTPTTPTRNARLTIRTPARVVLCAGGGVMAAAGVALRRSTVDQRASGTTSGARQRRTASPRGHDDAPLPRACDDVPF